MEKCLEHLTTLPPGFDPDSAIIGIRSLAVELGPMQSQIDQLRRSLSELRAKNGSNLRLAQEFDTARRELDALRKKAGPLEKKVRSNKRRLEELQKVFDDISKKAKENTANIILELTNDVIKEIPRVFESDGRYTSSEVATEVSDLLRDHAEQTLALIFEKGLL
jgi:predicted nuclease with TOPRIM domain